ncbi:MAG: PD40 domain-containing protein [Cyclobacteriaceae bacterium]|nr:PD40 domain-containing protein [Cyclobacteriaceae bacterium]
MKTILIFILSTSFHLLQAQTESIFGIFSNHSDIGDVKIDGTISYVPESDEYILGGSGENLWFSNDEFHFVWKTMEGDFVIYSKLELIGNNTEPHRKAGIMIRQSLEANAPYVDGVVHGDGLTSMQYREKINGETSEIQADIDSAHILQLERKGDLFIMKAAREGEPLEEFARYEIKLANSVYVGLMVCAHNEYNFQQAKFNNVRVFVPAAEVTENSREGAVSFLETIDIETLNRNLVRKFDVLIEAPNWSAKEPALVYNSQGNLYKINLDGGDPVQINTGSLNRLNNDHGISPDQRWIAVSNGDQDIGSRIYILPYEGGEPELITEKGPSYWHGWSKDSKTVAYVADRGGKSYNIYTCKRSGGKEKMLTDTDCLDDGPDYEPSGKKIYFNSCRTGTMQIWRMNTDGTDQEQVTFDDYQDWFPHPSPDGKWILFISYSKDVTAGSHPPNKQVMLRMMPAEGGEIKVITHLYGGQGTINVPSWSPDSRKVAFVSYSY